MSKDLSTRELALMLHTTVEEVRQARAADKPDLVSRTGNPPLLEEDRNAWYCKQRTGGKQYCLEKNGESYCMLVGKCFSQVESKDRNAKKCKYKG